MLPAPLQRTRKHFKHQHTHAIKGTTCRPEITLIIALLAPGRCPNEASWRYPPPLGQQNRSHIVLSLPLLSAASLLLLLLYAGS